MSDPFRRFREVANQRLSGVEMDERLRARILVAAQQAPVARKSRWLPTLIVTAAAMIVVGTCMSLLSSNIARTSSPASMGANDAAVRYAQDAEAGSGAAYDASTEAGMGGATALGDTYQGVSDANAGAPEATRASGENLLGQTFVSNPPKSGATQTQSSSAWEPALHVQSSSDRFGYIDDEGNWVIEPVYDTACDFGANARAIVGRYNEEGVMCYAVIDEQGVELTDFGYAIIEAFSGDIAPAVRLDGTICMLNVEGREISADESADGGDAILATATPTPTLEGKEKKK